MVADTPFKKQGQEVQIFGSCNGLFFIKIHGDLVTGFWNPATKEYRIIPSASIPVIGFKNGNYSPTIHSRVDRYGFGHDENTNDYKLVTIVSPYNKDILVSEVDVYSMVSNSWKRIDYIPYKVNGGPPGVFVNGALHWLANPCPIRSDNDQFSKVLLSLSLSEEMFTEIPQPHEVSDDKFEHKRIDVVEGFLSMLCSHSKVGFEVWVMKNYKVTDSWEKHYTISRLSIDVIPSFRDLRRVQSLKNGEILLEIRLEDKYKYAALVLYDPKHDRTRIMKIDLGKYNRWWDKSTNHLKSCFHTQTYMESLVSVYSGTYVGGGQEQEDIKKCIRPLGQ